MEETHTGLTPREAVVVDVAGFFGGSIAFEEVVPLIEGRDVDVLRDGRAFEGLETELVLGRAEIDGREEARDVREDVVPAWRVDDVLEDSVVRRSEGVGVLVVEGRAAVVPAPVLPVIRFDKPLLVAAFPASSPDVSDRLPSWSDMELLEAAVAAVRRVDASPPTGRVGGLFSELPNVLLDEELVVAAFCVLDGAVVTLPTGLFGGTAVADFAGATFSKFFNRLAMDDVPFSEGEGAESAAAEVGEAVSVVA
jgi:hypothetical protein